MRKMMRENAGINQEDKYILEARITPEVLASRQIDYRLLKDRANKREAPMAFWDNEIGEERKKELKEEVSKIRKIAPPLAEL
jgi:hypothetical protein